MKFDPATTAHIDQAQARARDSIDGLIDALLKVGDRCSCGGSIDSPQHTLSLVAYIRMHYPPEVLPMLLAETVGRLAMSKADKQ